MPCVIKGKKGLGKGIPLSREKLAEFEAKGMTIKELRKMWEDYERKSSI